MQMNDVQHPDHYTWKGVECKTVIESMTKGRQKAWTGRTPTMWATSSNTYTGIPRKVPLSKI